ncbi:MAG: 30S ribosomal protein S6 [Candidatus Woykebacteria bacterium RBG_16_44_10]|uniref:Small ribosomal subunit protein bS6 n=1 Tax=Candidatus Woykebacteria bacterium RBG_16_44_10 TaxID=1802597 RepID=A0A1G1WCK4_9BACT|nr:MAG: 30S ribosomal protein S6 [Candidatus Woykebacteria bacterium RBG_16_44_10]
MASEYELVTVVQTDINEEARGQLVDQIKKIVEAEEGEVVSVSEWGKRELAYEIKKNTHGFYTLISFRGNPKLPGILNSKLKLMEELLRYLVVKKEDKKFKDQKAKSKYTDQK